MKRPIATILCLAIGISALAGCSDKTDTTSGSSITSEVTTETTIETTEETTVETTEARGHYEFKPVVMSSIFREIMGEDMVEAYANYVEAFRNGEDSFAVKDANTYDWMIGQFPRRFYPVAEVYTESNYGSGYSDGTGTFQYKIPVEEFAAKNTEFEELVTNILNENLRDDYSDFEKVLALYIYIARNYTYDYETYYEMQDHSVADLSAYRFLTTGTGICSECAPAYSYLLLQAGVDATCCGGYDHEWSYVTINGRNYHVDATYAMGSDVCLSYLMMTDSRRETADGFPKSDNTIGCHYRDDHNGDQYDADDDFFAPLYGMTLSDWDPVANIIYCYDMDGNELEFDYSEFENR